MEKETAPNTEFKLWFMKHTFNSDDRTAYKVFVILTMATVLMVFLFTLSRYVLPMMFVNGSFNFIVKNLPKIPGIFKGIK